MGLTRSGKAYGLESSQLNQPPSNLLPPSTHSTPSISADLSAQLTLPQIQSANNGADCEIAAVTTTAPIISTAMNYLNEVI